MRKVNGSRLQGCPRFVWLDMIANILKKRKDKSLNTRHWPETEKLCSYNIF